MNRPLLILIFSILADVVCNNSMIQVFGVQTHFNPLILVATMLILQMLAAPIQAGFSDFYCRKKSLIFSLCFSFLGLLCFISAKSSGIFSMIFLWTGLFINASLGNIVPISWSALADSQEKNLRFFLALTTSAYAVGYIILAVLSKTVPERVSENVWLWQDILIPLGLIILAALLVWKFYVDLKDKQKSSSFSKKNEKPRFTKLAHSEFIALSKEINCRTTLLGMLAYFCWATSQYSSLLFLVNSQKYAPTVVIMMIGYFMGVAILGYYKRIADEKIIRLAFIITISSMFLFFILNPFMKDNNISLSACFFLYTLGNAFLTPSIFSLFSKEREIHEQGKGFGLIVSADSAGFLIAVFGLETFKHFALKIENVLLFSFIVFLISWFPYLAYEKNRRNAKSKRCK